MQEWAWLIAAGFWGLLVIFLCAALIGLYRVLQSTRDLVEDVRRQTVPILRELADTVDGVNRELVKVDELLTSVTGIAGAVEGITKTAQTVITHPATRYVGIAAGAARFLRKLRRKGDEDS